jgi:hypothetical protein
MLRRNWALIALVYLAFAEVLSWAPVPALSLCLRQPEHSEQVAHDNDQKYCPTFHMGIIASVDALDGFLERHDKSVVGGFTIVLAISTIGLWFATISLHKSGERQIALTRHSVKAAQRAAITAERALTVVERAFVMISDMNVVTMAQYGTIIDHRISINVLNSGRTPARNYRSNVNLVVIDDLPDNFRFADRAHEEPTPTVIGPQSRTYFQIDFFIQDALATFEKRKETFIYGWIEYDDLFPQSDRHRTEFCLAVEVFADPRATPEMIQGKSIPLLTIRPHGRYNAYDEDCLYRPGQTPVAEEGELPIPTEPLVISPPPGFQQPPQMSVQFQYSPPQGG